MVKRDKAHEKNAEDRVVMYMTPRPHGGFADELLAGFCAQHPGVKAEYVHETPARFIERVLVEKEQGRHDADIMLLSSQMMEVLKIRGYLEPYESPEGATFPQRARDADGYGVQLWTVPFSVACNTDRVASAEFPKSYDDLLDPKWKGKLLFPDPRTSSSGQPWFTVMQEHLGNEFLERLAAQDLCCEYAHAEEKLADGEYCILVPALVGIIEKMKAAGKPVDWVAMPAMQTGGPYAVLFRHAQHLEMGRRLIDFLLSAEGQRIVSKNHVPNRPGVPAQSKLTEAVLEKLKGAELLSLKAIHGREYHQKKAEATRLLVRTPDAPSGR